MSVWQRLLHLRHKKGFNAAAAVLVDSGDFNKIGNRDRMLHVKL